MYSNIQSAFSDALALPSRVAVYVPGTAGPTAADPALAERMTAETAARLADLFGGSTIQPAEGAWISAAHGLVRESVNIVYSFAIPDALNNRAPEIRELVDRIKTEMQQEAVSVEIGDTLYLV